uniref:Uncharacterized protein n=1 Tax=Leersia perrieri TaxID=77586 RepID=A0A0D9VI75_9ORYZ
METWSGVLVDPTRDTSTILSSPPRVFVTKAGASRTRFRRASPPEPYLLSQILALLLLLLPLPPPTPTTTLAAATSSDLCAAAP